MGIDSRPPAVAGLFYPAEPGLLAAEVDGWLAATNGRDPAASPKALLVPHAGYPYSGAIAGAAYAAVRGRPVGRVVLLGPAHRVAFHGIAAPTVAAFMTPLGAVPVATGAVADLGASVLRSDAPHAAEHSLEVQLPFLQRALGRFELVPLVVGDAPPSEVAAVIEALYGGPETLLVLSSDLSHYEPYEAARAHDARTLGRILALDEGVGGRDACGFMPLRGLMRVARAHRLRPELIDACTSGDTAGSRDQVVGYAAVAFYETEPSAQRAQEGGPT